MTPSGMLQLFLYLVVLLALVKPLGLYMARVYEGRSIGLDCILGSVERLIYRRIDASRDGLEGIRRVLFRPIWHSTPPSALPRTRTGRATAASPR